MKTIQENPFAEACYDQNSIASLEEALAGEADQTDMKQWGLTADECKEQIKLALNELKSEL